jgi:hypothetical protein
VADDQQVRAVGLVDEHAARRAAHGAHLNRYVGQRAAVLPTTESTMSRPTFSRSADSSSTRDGDMPDEDAQ